MQYPEDLLAIAERIVATAHEVPREPNQWSHITDYHEPEWIVPGLYLARILVQFHGNHRLVRAAIKALAHESGVEFDEEVKSLHELTWALDDALAFLNLVDLQAMVGFLGDYLGRLEHELDGCPEDDEDEDDDEDEGDENEGEDEDDDD